MSNKLKKARPSKENIKDGKFYPNLKHTLKELVLENFKGYAKETRIKFSPSINLFYGKNSSGKSSIIQSLRLLKQSLLIIGPPAPLVLIPPSYTRITGSLSFQEGLEGIVNSKDLSKNLKLGMSSYENIMTYNGKEVWPSRFLEHTFDNRKIDDVSVKEIKYGRVLSSEENYQDKLFSLFDLKFKTKYFKKNDEVAKVFGGLYKNPIFDFKYNIEARLKDKKVPKHELLYEELDIKNSKIELRSMFDVHKRILKDSKKSKNKILETIKAARNRTYGVDYRNIKKLTGKQKDRSIGDKILSEGRFSLISDQDLIKLEKFVNSQAFLSPTSFFKFFTDDIYKKIVIIRYKDKLLDLKSITATLKGYNNAVKYNVLPSKKYDIYLYSIVLTALGIIEIDFSKTFEQSIENQRRTIDNIVVVPGLRALPQRYLKRGLTENLIGERAENLGDLIANKENKNMLNYWFGRFEIPYTIDTELVGNFYEIILKPLGKKYKLSYKDVGLGYSLSLPLLVTCLTSRNSIILVEEPELHLHPKLQASLMDLFLHSSIAHNNQFVIETHSENILLRAQKNIRKGFDYKGKKINIGREIISVNNVYVENNSSRVQKIELDDKGEFKTHWKDGFFAERLDEIF